VEIIFEYYSLRSVFGQLKNRKRLLSATILLYPVTNWSRLINVDVYYWINSSRIRESRRWLPASRLLLDILSVQYIKSLYRRYNDSDCSQIKTVLRTRPQRLDSIYWTYSNSIFDRNSWVSPVYLGVTGIFFIIFEEGRIELLSVSTLIHKQSVWRSSLWYYITSPSIYER
jgi:hypothetical protein